MSKKIKIVNGLVIAENNRAEMKENGNYQFSVFTKEEFSYPSGFRVADMNFDNITEAESFCKDWEN